MGWYDTLSYTVKPLSIVDTIETCLSVLIKEVSLFQSVLIREVTLYIYTRLCILY